VVADFDRANSAKVESRLPATINQRRCWPTLVLVHSEGKRQQKGTTISITATLLVSCFAF
jgi:hypothetical protein